MTIQSSVNDGITHDGNDATTTFSFPFKVNSESQIEVVVRDSSGNEVTKVLNTDYSVSNPTAEGSGSITYPISGSPLATGSSITITPKMDYLQSTDIRNQGRFAPETHEDAFDTLMMHIKELRGLVNRTIKFKKSSELTGAEFGQDPVDNRVIAWDGATGKTKNIAAADIDATLVSSVWEAILDDTDLKALINGLTAITTLQDADQLTVADNSDSDNNKKITFANFKTEIAKLMVNALTEITTLEGDDQLPVADQSDSNNSKKITFGNFSKTLFRKQITIANNSTDSDHDIDFSAGVEQVADQSNVVTASAKTKQIDATWAAGDDAGGLADGVSLSTNTWYHCFLLSSADGATTDFGFDTSITATNLLADSAVSGTGLTKYKRVGSIITDSSSNIKGFQQRGNQFRWETEVTEVNVSSSIPTSQTDLLIATPIDVITEAIMTCYIRTNSATYQYPEVFFKDKNLDSEVLINANGRGGDFTGLGANWFTIHTDTSRTIQYRATDSAGWNLIIYCNGWIDYQL